MNLKGLLSKLHINFHKRQRDEDLQGRPAEPVREKAAMSFRMIQKRPPNRRERRYRPAHGLPGLRWDQKGCFGKPGRWWIAPDQRAEPVALAAMKHRNKARRLRQQVERSIR